ncbi:hypothetical protein V2J09_018370 [Rumex salicifolius]
MVPENSHLHRHSLSSSSSYAPSLLDALFCEEQEEQWEEEPEEEEEQKEMGKVDYHSPSLSPILMLENDLFWEDEELRTLFFKEKQMDLNIVQCLDSSPFSTARREAVEWILIVNSYFGFSTLTAILSVNYLDRFLHKSTHLYQQNKPWMIQLTAVTCLSLAAKVEEIDVPLLIDLQVPGTNKYVFETKTIQKMELLILTTLDWRMNPVTPISFLDHIIRRLRLKNHLLSDFHRRGEQLLLSIVADSRFVTYLPSILATATMIHASDQIDHSNSLDYQNQLLTILNISKEKVNHCYEMIQVSLKSAHTNGIKRDRQLSHESPTSPKAVIDAYYFSSDTSNDSSTLTGGRLSRSPSVSSSPAQRALKRSRVDEQSEPLGPFGGADGVAMISIISYLAASLMRHVVIKELQAFFLYGWGMVWEVVTREVEIMILFTRRCVLVREDLGRSSGRHEEKNDDLGEQFK